jgi:hypothetical protein
MANSDWPRIADQEQAASTIEGYVIFTPQIDDPIQPDWQYKVGHVWHRIGREDLESPAWCRITLTDLRMTWRKPV